MGVNTHSIYQGYIHWWWILAVYTPVVYVVSQWYIHWYCGKYISSTYADCRYLEYSILQR